VAAPRLVGGLAVAAPRFVGGLAVAARPPVAGELVGAELVAGAQVECEESRVEVEAESAQPGQCEVAVAELVEQVAGWVVDKVAVPAGTPFECEENRLTEVESVVGTIQPRRGFVNPLQLCDLDLLRFLRSSPLRGVWV